MQRGAAGMHKGWRRRYEARRLGPGTARVAKKRESIATTGILWDWDIRLVIDEDDGLSGTIRFASHSDSLVYCATPGQLEWKNVGAATTTLSSASACAAKGILAANLAQCCTWRSCSRIVYKHRTWLASCRTRPALCPPFRRKGFAGPGTT